MGSTSAPGRTLSAGMSAASSIDDRRPGRHRHQRPRRRAPHRLPRDAHLQAAAQGLAARLPPPVARHRVDSNSRPSAPESATRRTSQRSDWRCNSAEMPVWDRFGPRVPSKVPNTIRVDARRYWRSVLPKVGAVTDLAEWLRSRRRRSSALRSESSAITWVDAGATGWHRTPTISA